MSDQRCRASVIVCTYSADRLDHLLAAVTAVRQQLLDGDELIVVVDHNPALRDDLRSRLLDDVVVTENREQRGLSGARNSGIALARAEIVVFLDDDALPRARWLEHLLRPFSDLSVAGVGGHAAPAWERGSRPGWFPETLDWVVGCSYLGQAGGDVRNPIGCSMAFRASVLNQVGGFVHDLGRVGTIPLGCEETELGLRVNRAGGRIVMAVNSVVDHFVPLERSTLAYMLRRCYAEGISKAEVRRLAAGARSDRDTLEPERLYVVQLARACSSAICESILRRSPGVAAQAVVIPSALFAAGIGFSRGFLRRSG